jgi:hypothetical protein
MQYFLISIRLQAGARYYYSFHSVQTSTGTPKAANLIRIAVLSRGVNRSGLEADRSPSSSVKLENVKGKAIPVTGRGGP